MGVRLGILLVVILRIWAGGEIEQSVKTLGGTSSRIFLATVFGRIIEVEGQDEYENKKHRRK